MQRRAIRDAKTPEKMKQAKPVVDDSLTLQGKKDKIKSNLQRLAELGKVDPQNRYQDLINDIAKVSGTRADSPGCLFYSDNLQLRLSTPYNGGKYAPIKLIYSLLFILASVACGMFSMKGFNGQR